MTLKIYVIGEGTVPLQVNLDLGAAPGSHCRAQRRGIDTKVLGISTQDAEGDLNRVGLTTGGCAHNRQRRIARSCCLINSEVHDAYITGDSRGLVRGSDSARSARHREDNIVRKAGFTIHKHVLCAAPALISREVGHLTAQLKGTAGATRDERKGEDEGQSID